MDNQIIIERYSEPSEIDTLPLYTICITERDKIWVQASPEIESPVWLQFHSLNEAVQFIEEKKSSK
jgi:hypothetical protein